MPREVQRGLTGRVSGSNDADVAAFHCLRLAPGRSVENAGADQRLEARHAETAPGDAGRDDDRFGRDLVAIGEVHNAFVSPTLQADGRLREHQVCAEHPGLLTRPTRELMSTDAVR